MFHSCCVKWNLVINVECNLSYKPPSSWRILFLPRVYPRQFIRLKHFRSMAVPSGGCHKGVIIQVILTPMAVLPNGQAWLRKKGYITGGSVHAPIHRNSMHIQTIIRSIYKTRRPKYPHSPIFRYQQRPQGPTSWPCYSHLK